MSVMAKQENGMPACAGMTPVFIVSSLSKRTVTPAKAGVPCIMEIKESDYRIHLTTTSSTILRYRRNRQLIDTFILGMAVMAFDPDKLNLVRRHRCLQPLP